MEVARVIIPKTLSFPYFCLCYYFHVCYNDEYFKTNILSCTWAPSCAYWVTVFLCYFKTKYFTAVLGLLPVLLDRVHPVELGQSHLPHLAVHQGCPTNLPETFHPGSFALYFRPFYSHPFTDFFFKYSSLFSVTKLKMICQQELPLKINHPWWMSRFFFLFTFVLTMGTSFIQFYRLAMFLFHPSIYNFLLPPLPAARVVAPASWLRHLPQHPPRGASTPHTPQVNQPVQVHQCGQWISC